MNKNDINFFGNDNLVISDNDIPHFLGGRLSQHDIMKLKVGDYFTYETNTYDKNYFCKGLVVAHGIMIPIGLPCVTLDRAREQY